MKWEKNKLDNKTEYLIEVERKIICFGDPGHLYRWEYFASFEDQAERDRYFSKNCVGKAHIERFRKRDTNPWKEKLIARFEH